LPVKFSETPGKVRAGAPVYGQHTREVLREHGFDEQQIAEFERERAVLVVPSTKAGQAVI
jgi:crotonobetainyl-CoA:carnitine CoA-transferase CaiB-like acyl-CoA transferase